VSLLLAIAVALAEPAATPAHEPAAVEDAEVLPTPFTADQIRTAMPVGRVIDWAETQGDTTTLKRWTVTAADGDTATVRFEGIGANGVLQKGEAADKTFTFEELRSHASFPSALATRAAVEITGPVGAGAGWRYVVRSPPGVEPATVTTFTFATSLPGAPVRMETRAGDTVVHELKQTRRAGP